MEDIEKKVTKSNPKVELIIDEDLKVTREKADENTVLLINELIALRNIERIKLAKGKVEQAFSFITFGTNIGGENELLVGMFKKDHLSSKEAMKKALTGDYGEDLLVFKWQAEWIEAFIK